MKFLTCLPDDRFDAKMLFRMDRGDGPCVIYSSQSEVFDVTSYFPTSADFIDNWSHGVMPKLYDRIGTIDDVAEDIDSGRAKLLSPIDVQSVKAAGVTFAHSALERVIEEKARGNAGLASAIRLNIEDRIGAGLRSIRPGSIEASSLKIALQDEGLWSQYLEVAVRPDAEIFTKAQPLSTVGCGAAVGIRSDSSWNNPEPELVLIIASDGTIAGCTLGNDVNLRCFEGRSALLLGKAKDNNASCSIGPVIRLFDTSFTLTQAESAEITLEIVGFDGFTLRGSSPMAAISRRPVDLVTQALSQHNYPDGLALMLGTLFTPTQDRDIPGMGFTHKRGDTVTISTPRLGRLVNYVTYCDDAPPWNFGIRKLFDSLSKRGLTTKPQ